MLSKFANLQLAKFVTERLRGPGNVAVGFGLKGGLVHGAGFAEEFHDLIARPTFGVDSRVHHQAHGAKQLRGKPAVIGNRILVKADLPAELFGVKCPALCVGRETQSVNTELRQTGELLLYGELQVMAGNAFVVGDGLVVNQRALRKVRSSDYHAARPLAVWRADHVVGGRAGVEGWYRLHRHWRFWKKGKQLRQLGLHLRDVTAGVFQDLILRPG